MVIVCGVGTASPRLSERPVTGFTDSLRPAILLSLWRLSPEKGQRIKAFPVPFPASLTVIDILTMRLLAAALSPASALMLFSDLSNFVGNYCNC
jgi:hypothetical protein